MANVEIQFAEDFQKRVDRMEGYLRVLEQCDPIPITSPDIPSIPAIYAFFENEAPCYVGRSGDKQKLRKRIGNHQRSTHNAASFVYKRTCKALGLGRVYKKGSGGTREERMQDPDFLAEFGRQRDALLTMQVRFVEIHDPIDQYLFELYATLRFGLDTEGFGTH